jgi:D-beta-D-heptose 7-phosphate kinase/D-beta-D-heptose 1-phosphate adenosyltransferase
MIRSLSLAVPTRSQSWSQPFAVYDLRPYNLVFHPMRKKILSREELTTERARLRGAGKKLVFTNGVFDILHVGHVRYLQAARALGDALVVAVNSDNSARELKGAGRPLTNENDRAEILAALACVDYVTMFDELSPRSLIAELLPDVLVKGGDYALDQIHGREEVEAAGGRVLSLPFVEGFSTSTIIERMKQVTMSDE